MSDIATGDLVVVVGTYCDCQAHDIGYIATVESMSIQGTECFICHTTQPPTLTAEIVERRTGQHAWKPLAILRKIEPLADQFAIEMGAEVS